MSSVRQGTQADTPAWRLAELRGNCMGAAVLLIIQFGIGIGINLYVTVPEHKPFLSAVFGSAVLATHAIVAIVLLGAAIGAVVRGHPSQNGDRAQLGRARGDRCRRDRRVIVRGQREQRCLARHGAGHCCRNVLLPGRGLQPPLTLSVTISARRAG
jgi:hypothetical protein